MEERNRLAGYLTSSSLARSQTISILIGTDESSAIEGGKTIGASSAMKVSRS